MIAYIDTNKDRFGVEPICQLLQGLGVSLGHRRRACADSTRSPP
jgi:hypothetical protein